MRMAALLVLVGASWAAEPEYGIWKMNPVRSSSSGDSQPRSFTVRVERHSKGEVFTLDGVETDGRATSSSTILYFDGVARDFQQDGYTGTQSSWRMDSQTVEIFRNCGAGAWTKFVRRTALKTQLVLEISERRADGRRFDRRLVFEKQ
jgi:hypothetical protein